MLIKCSRRSRRKGQQMSIRIVVNVKVILLTYEASNMFALASRFNAWNESGDDPSMTTKFNPNSMYLRKNVEKNSICVNMFH